MLIFRAEVESDRQNQRSSKGVTELQNRVSHLSATSDWV